MASTYIRNSSGRVARVPWQQPWAYVVGSILLIVVGVEVWNLANLVSGPVWDIRPGLAPLVIGLILLGGVGLVVVAFRFVLTFQKKYDIKSGISGYVTDRRAEKAIERGLLSAGLVKRTVSETMVDVPACDIHEVDHRKVLKIERLPSVSDISAVAQAVNSSLRFGKYADYAVSDPKETADGLYYIFDLVDVNSDLAFRPSKIEELVSDNPYRLRLDRHTYWHYGRQPHAIIVGQTSSKKTTTAFCLMAQAVAIGARVVILDYKSEMIGLKSVLGDENVVQDPGDILRLLEKLVEELHQRNEYIGLETAKRGSMGLTGADLGLRPVFIFCEELGALSEAYDSKEKKEFHGYLKQLGMLGRVSLMSILLVLQVASVDSCPTSIKANTNLRILLGKTSSEMVTQVFSGGFADLVSNNPGDFKGWYYLQGETTQPSLFHVPDLYSGGFNTMETFTRLYEIGRKREYNDIAY